MRWRNSSEGSFSGRTSTRPARKVGRALLADMRHNRLELFAGVGKHMLKKNQVVTEAMECYSASLRQNFAAVSAV